MGGLSISLIVLMRTMVMVAVEGSLCSATFLRSIIYHIKHFLYIGLSREQYHPFLYGTSSLTAMAALYLVSVFQQEFEKPVQLPFLWACPPNHERLFQEPFVNELK